ncbi:hypothetical protein FOL47_009845 [Perkinsus chesapeaki]|uniref:Uncharacterized protein n=1 Tax=Perkinsus chesapeaki TaxID=330153 RepID=A0A7J6L669_PERCH|nr:hypothetical protein FOL47_009845 [Perkinsus chesapeaki]
MLRSARFALFFPLYVKAQPDVVLDNTYLVESNTSYTSIDIVINEKVIVLDGFEMVVDKNYTINEVDIADDEPPYGRPVGHCHYDDEGHLLDCKCPDGQSPFVGTIQGQVGAGMCLPSCMLKGCPPFPNSGEPTACIGDYCFVVCKDPCTLGTTCYYVGGAYGSLCLYRLNFEYDNGSGNKSLP